MLPESLLSLAVLVEYIRWSDLGQYFLDTVKSFLSFLLLAFVHETLDTTVRLIDFFLELILTIVHLDQRKGNTECSSKHNCIQGLE